MNKNDELDQKTASEIGLVVRDLLSVLEGMKMVELSSQSSFAEKQRIKDEIEVLTQKQGKIRSGLGTVKDFARAILEGDGYWGEMQVLVDGKKVNMELIITYVDGKKCGDQYIPSSSLPKWKRWIKRVLNI